MKQAVTIRSLWLLFLVGTLSAEGGEPAPRAQGFKIQEAGNETWLVRPSGERFFPWGYVSSVRAWRGSKTPQVTVSLTWVRLKMVGEWTGNRSMNFQKSYFIKFGSPAVYGQLHLETQADSNYVILTYLVNPDGSRNPEPRQGYFPSSSRWTH